MLNWLIVKWDLWVYHRAFHSLRRMCERNPGFAILIKLHLEKYLTENPVAKEVERSATTFYKSQVQELDELRRTLDYQATLRANDLGGPP